MLNKGKKGRTVEQRLNDMSFESDNGCIEWSGCKDKDGYGFIRLEGKNQKAHRVSFSIANKIEITKDQFICHSCDNPSCINPDHLWVGDNSSNQIDSVNKKRNAFQKMTIEDVKKAREDYFSGKKTQAELCKIHKVSDGLMSLAINGKKWRHVN